MDALLYFLAGQILFRSGFRRVSRETNASEK